MKLCLNMIVKNEAARITRALDSIVQFIDCYAITDTGSTDDTVKVIKEYFKLHKVPGVVSHAPFIDWSQARNSALLLARSVQARFGWNYAILMDADMEWVCPNFPKLEDMLAAGGPSYDMEQRAGSLHYGNRRIINAKATGFYRGVTHEFLDVHSAGFIGPDVAYFIDHADGANRPEKYKRDIRLLLAGLEKEPNNERYFYYLAQSYRDAGEVEKAKEWYQKRVQAGGWQEEQWSAQVNYATCFKDQGDEAGFIREMLLAYNMRPSRAESLYDLAHYFRQKDGMQSIAALFAEVGMNIPKSTDLLFVNDHVYQSGLKEEFAIAGFYNETQRPKAFKVCSNLSITPGPYPSARDTTRFNLYWYLPTLVETCPSFRSQPMKFMPPEGWVALNPSVTVHGNNMWCVIRTVNYEIDGDGRYMIRGTDGTANDSNPINTRNWLIDLGVNAFGRGSTVMEIVPPKMPCEFKPVIGCEDMRLFSHNGEMWGSSTVRQIHWDGNCEQVLTKINDPNYYRRMLPEKRETQKNWAPIVGGNMMWMHRPGVVIDWDGVIIHDTPSGVTNDIISGGSQVIPCDNYLIALVHTAHQIPGSACRYYYHRWAYYDPHTFALVSLSMPFVFDAKVIEFASGLCHHPEDPELLVITYGSRDNEAKIATIKKQEVMKQLWSSK